MRRLLCGLPACALAGFAVPVWADDSSTQYTLEIEQQPIVAALTEFSRQTGLQVGYLPESPEEENAIVAPLKGQYSIDSALRELLAPSGLSFEKINDRTIAVGSKGDGSLKYRSYRLDHMSMPGRNREITSRSIDVSSREALPVRGVFRNRLRLAQAEIILDNQKGSASLGSGNQSSVALPTSENDRTKIEEIVVTGSRLRTAAKDLVPVIVFDRDKLDEMGVSSIASVLNYLPQQPAADFDSNRFGRGAVFPQLRGVGVDTTLILINGRRVIASASSVAFNAFDLNTIPLNAVDRIELLSDSASAVYGADAVGGVVNVILKKEIPEPIVDLRYGTAAGGARERNASFSAGFANERIRGGIVADYSDLEPLPGTERDLYANQDYRRFGSSDRRSSSSNPGNICSTDGNNLPGLSSACAAVPHGSTGVGLTTADFIATSGQQNLVSLNSFTWPIGKRDSESGLAFAEVDLSASLTIFADVLYVDRTYLAPAEPAGLQLTVPSTNPFNPFGTDVVADYLFEGVGLRPGTTDSRFYRAVGGIRGEIGTWGDWELSVADTNEKSEFRFENDVDADKAIGALAATDSNQALNVFQDGPGGSPDLLASLIAAPFVSRGRSESTVGNGFVRGSLFALPAGRAEVVVGGELRREKMDFGSFQADRDISAVFSELRLPLVSAEMQVPMIKSLALTAAARYDKYNDFGDTINPQYSLVWTPVEDLALRLAYGSSFKAPTLFDLYAPSRISVGFQVTDPRRNNETVGITRVRGGNPDLRPLDANSFTAGFVFDPAWKRGLRLSANYWQLKIRNRSVGLFPDLLIEFEDLFPGRVIRAAPTPADIAANLPGRIESVNSTVLNFGSLETSGIDVNVSQSIDTRFGRIAVNLFSTWVEKYRALDVPGTPIQDFVGTTSPILGALPRWRAIGTLSWARDPVGASVTANYMSAYDDATFAGPTGRVIRLQTLVDVQGFIDLGKSASDGPSWLSGVKITVGVLNLFDRLPSFAEVGGTQGYDPSQGNIRGRFGYLSVSKAF